VRENGMDTNRTRGEARALNFSSQHFWRFLAHFLAHSSSWKCRVVGHRRLNEGGSGPFRTDRTQCPHDVAAANLFSPPEIPRRLATLDRAAYQRERSALLFFSMPLSEGLPALSRGSLGACSSRGGEVETREVATRSCGAYSPARHSHGIRPTRHTENPPRRFGIALHTSFFRPSQLNCMAPSRTSTWGQTFLGVVMHDSGRQGDAH
jgi:hypothetical protein